jgi:acyl-CoA thioesterase II
VPASVPRSFSELIALDQSDDTTFVGQTPAYPWGRVFGGQVVAQSLAAAAATAPADHFVHSLHAYFVLGGVPLEPIVFEVDRLREGRSFTTRRVVARQSAGAILNLDASFQRIEDDVEIQETQLPAGVPGPETLAAVDWPGLGEVREVANQPAVARSQVWMRIAEDLGDDRITHACALAYLSDHNPMDAIILSHPASLRWDEMMTASLDHNIWFHRHVRADGWMLFDMQGHGLVNARGMATGAVHAEDGRHVATIAQEGLVRSPRR